MLDKHEPAGAYTVPLTGPVAAMSTRAKITLLCVSGLDLRARPPLGVPKRERKARGPATYASP